MVAWAAEDELALTMKTAMAVYLPAAAKAVTPGTLADTDWPGATVTAGPALLVSNPEPNAKTVCPVGPVIFSKLPV